MANKLFSFLITVTPGIYRLVVIFFINHFCAAGVIKDYVNIYILATGLSLFSGLGSSINLLKHSGGEVNNNVLKKNYVEHYISSIVLAIIVFILSLSINKSLNYFYLFFCIMSLSTYQVFRHYYLSNKKFKTLLIFDVLNLTATIIIGLFDVMLAIISSNLLFGFFLLLKSLSRNVEYKFKWVLISSCKLGYSNLVSSGVMYIIPSLILIISNSETAYVLSMVVTISSVIMIIPRVLMNNTIPQISKDARSGFVDYDTYNSFNKKLLMICLFITPFAMITSYFYLFVNKVNIFNLGDGYFYIISSLMLMLVISQLSLLDSMLIYFLKKEKIALIANSIIFLLVLIILYGAKTKFIEITNYKLLIVIVFSFITLGYSIRYKIFKSEINMFVVLKS